MMERDTLQDTESYSTRSDPMARGGERGESASLLDFFFALWADRWIVIAVGSVIFLFVMAVSLLLTPKYRSSALLAPVEIDDPSSLPSIVGSQLGGLAALAGIGGSSGSGKEEALALLTSRRFTTDFIVEENLLPILFQGEWDRDAAAWKSSADAPTPQDGYKLFHRNVRSVNVDRKTGLITFSVIWKDPVLAAEWVDKLVSRANEQLRVEAIAEAKRNIEFLEAEIENTAIINVRTAIYDLISSNINKIMLASTRVEYAFRVIDPPVAADEDKYVSPNYVLFALLGIVLGGTGACAVVYLRRFARRHTPA